MNNETGEPVEWGDYWVDHVHQRAHEAGVTVHTTDMRRNEDIHADDHAHVYDDPERYTFLDISQNNATTGFGQDHFDNIAYVRNRTADAPRPINNVKNYGAVRHGEEESVARFCRIVFAGCASARFHRPHPLEDPDDHKATSDFGLGLSPRAQAVIQSMRAVTDNLDLLEVEPRNDLLDDREPDEAYLLASPGHQYALYFPNVGSVAADLSDARGDLVLRWLDVDAGDWAGTESVEPASNVRLDAPGDGHWIAILSDD